MNRSHLKTALTFMVCNPLIVAEVIGFIAGFMLESMYTNKVIDAEVTPVKKRTKK